MKKPDFHSSVIRDSDFQTTRLTPMRSSNMIIVLMVETSCNKIESIELISFESSKASMAAPHSRQSHQNFIT